MFTPGAATGRIVRVCAYKLVQMKAGHVGSTVLCGAAIKQRTNYSFYQAKCINKKILLPCACSLAATENRCHGKRKKNNHPDIPGGKKTQKPGQNQAKNQEIQEQTRSTRPSFKNQEQPGCAKTRSLPGAPGAAHKTRSVRF